LSSPSYSLTTISNPNLEPLGTLSWFLGFALEVILSRVFSYFSSAPSTTSVLSSQVSMVSSVGKASLTIILVGPRLLVLSAALPNTLHISHSPHLHGPPLVKRSRASSRRDLILPLMDDPGM